jgi:hypothetical protein
MNPVKCLLQKDKFIQLDSRIIKELLKIYDTHTVVQEAVNFYQNDLFCGMFLFNGEEIPEQSVIYKKVAKDYLRMIDSVGFAIFIIKDNEIPCVLDIEQLDIHYYKSYDNNIEFKVYERSQPVQKYIKNIHVRCTQPPTFEGYFRSQMSRLKQMIEDDLIRTSHLKNVVKLRANPSMILEEERDKTIVANDIGSAFAMPTITNQPAFINTQQLKGANEGYNQLRSLATTGTLINQSLNLPNTRIELAPGKKLVQQILPEPPNDYLQLQESTKEHIYNSFGIPIGMISSNGSNRTKSEENNLYMFDRAQARRLSELVEMVKEQRKIISYLKQKDLKKSFNEDVTITSIPSQDKLIELYKMGSIPFDTLKKFSYGIIPEIYWCDKPILTLQEINGSKDIHSDTNKKHKTE